MTIDKAIEYADMLANDASTVWEIPMVEIQRLNTLCAGALRLAKKMSEENGLTEETENVRSELQAVECPDCWQERRKREYREMKERYEKLHRMVTKYEAGTLKVTPKCSIELLKQQKRHMGEYLHDLEIRAEIDGVEL